MKMQKRATAWKTVKLWQYKVFLISNVLRVLNAVFFLFSDSPAYEFYVMTFRNIVPPSKAAQACEYGAECSETSAHKIETPENHPKERIQKKCCLTVHPQMAEAFKRGCPVSIQPLWMSREPVAWPWCNLAACQMRPYCASVNSHSLMGLVSRKWDAVDWVCVLCDGRIHKSPAFQRRFWLWEKPEVAESQILAVAGLTDLGDVMLCPPTPKKKPCTTAVGWAYALSWWSYLLARSLWMRPSHNTQAQSAASHCRLTSPMREWLFTDAQ